MPKPHIIYILADDMGYGDLSCLNPQCAWKTPALDKMAKGGMAFLDAHSSSAVCTPSRYNILTGRYNWRSALHQGVTWGNSRPLLEKGRTTVASFLKKQGYETACFGKWHLGWDWGHLPGTPESQLLTAPLGEVATRPMAEIDFTAPISGGPLDHGFDHFFGIAASLDMPPYVWVKDRLPTACPDRQYPGSTGKQMARPGPQAPDFVHEAVLPTLTQKVREHLRLHQETPQFIYFPLPAPHTPILPTAAFRGKSATTDYGDFVLMCDETVGQIFEELRSLGILENTLVVFTSDNGCSPMAGLGELATFGHNPSYHFRGHKSDIFEGGHRVPFLAHWSRGIRGGSQCATTICLGDFLATAAAITGVPLENHEGEDSVDLTPLFQNGAPGPSPELREATVHHSINGSFSIRKGPWKLEFCPDSGGWSDPKPGDPNHHWLPPIQLYHLGKDVGETQNIHMGHKALIEEMTQLLINYIREGRSTPGGAQPNHSNMEKIIETILRRSEGKRFPETATIEKESPIHL